MKYCLLLLLIVLFSGLTPRNENKAAIELIANKKLYPQALLRERYNSEQWAKLDSITNKQYWYLEVQYPFATNFTPLWNDYQSSQYHANSADFKEFFQGKDSIPLAIQIGPTWWDLWAYRQLVFHQIGSYVVVANSYFRHNRFTYKGISILTAKQFQVFYSHLKDLDERTLKTLGSLEYTSEYSEEWQHYDTLTNEIILKTQLVHCNNNSLASGIVVDNRRGKAYKLYGLSGSVCEQKDSLVSQLVKYYQATWLQAFSDMKWKNKYPKELH